MPLTGLTTTQPNPLQVAHRVLRGNDVLREGLNAIQKRVYRPMSEIVLFICLEYYLPEFGIALRTDSSDGHPDGQLTTVLMGALRGRKKGSGVTLARSIAEAVGEWIHRNVKGFGQFGEAIWVGEELWSRPPGALPSAPDSPWPALED